jgi:hypothetical protein
MKCNVDSTQQCTHSGDALFTLDPLHGLLTVLCTLKCWSLLVAYLFMAGAVSACVGHVEGPRFYAVGSSTLMIQTLGMHVSLTIPDFFEKRTVKCLRSSMVEHLIRNQKVNRTYQVSILHHRIVPGRRLFFLLLDVCCCFFFFFCAPPLTHSLTRSSLHYTSEVFEWHGTQNQPKQAMTIRRHRLH